MKKLLVTAASVATLAACVNSWGYSKGEVKHCCKDLKPFLGIQGGWVYDSHKLLNTDQDPNQMHKKDSSWGVRGEIGFDYNLSSSWSFVTNFGGGYYNKYDPFPLNDDTVVNARVDHSGFDLAMGPVFHMDNFYGAVEGGMFLSKLDLPEGSNTTDPSPYPTGMTLDRLPLIRVEVGYEWNAFQFNLAYMHAFTTHSDQDGWFNAVGSHPALDTLFVGARYVWDGSFS